MSTGSAVAVVAAASVLALVVGVLLTLPVWRGGAGPRLVSALLTVQAGGVLVLGAIATTAAARSWLLVDRDPARAAGSTLISVSRIDGDGSMFALVVLGIVALTGLAAVLLLLGARFAASAHTTERAIACAVLGLEIGLSGYGLAACLNGSRSAAALVAVVNLPLAMAAMIACWPPHVLDLLPSFDDA